jgi:prephenate dehydrogenase
MIKKLAVIGVGLIGGSLALALKKAHAVDQVSGYSRNATTRQEAKDLGIIDIAADSIQQAVTGADMIFVAVPMGAMQQVLTEIAEYAPVDAVITDGGSAKMEVVKAAEQGLTDSINRFVPGHPIAGTERSGPSAAFAELYQDHRVVLTPIEQTDKQALEKVRAMWQVAGADVFDMNVEHHDTVLAATSHIPHVLAFNLVGMLSERDDCDEVLRYAAGGFRDFSRIASSDPVMWRDICLTNKQAVLNLLKQYQQDLAKIEMAIENQDGDYLIDVFSRAKKARDTRFNDPTLIDNSEV